MSLKAFHILFILVASTWCGWFAYWAFSASRDGRGGFWLGVSALAGLAFLVPYLRGVLRKYRRAVPALVMAIMLPEAARACAVCFGTGADSVVVGRAFNVGLFFLTGVTMAVIASVVIWIYRIERSRRG